MAYFNIEIHAVTMIPFAETIKVHLYPRIIVKRRDKADDFNIISEKEIFTEFKDRSWIIDENNEQ